MKNPDVLIIGAGVVGASIAWHLARAGMRRIQIVDRSPAPASGSTARATGGFRAQFGSSINVQLSLLSREKLLLFEDEVGVNPGFQQAGYLFVATGDDDAKALMDAIPVQRAAGLDEVVVLEHADVRRINPWLDPRTYCGGTFSPRDGFIRPLEIANGYLNAATALGVELNLGVESLALETSQGRVSGVRTSDGRIEPGAVVNAGGAWAAAILAGSGIHLPVTSLRRQVARTAPTDRLPSTMPMTIYAGDGYHLRVRDGRVLLLWPDDPRDPTSANFDDDWLATVRRMTDERVPCLSDIAIEREHCWAGLYEMTPDRHAILGRSAELENLYLANGSSGHGVMHAPALGQLLAEIITEGYASTLDVQALRASRFSENDPVRGSSLL